MSSASKTHAHLGHASSRPLSPSSSPSPSPSPSPAPSPSSRPALIKNGKLLPSKLSPLDALASQTKQLSIKRDQRHPPPITSHGDLRNIGLSAPSLPSSNYSNDNQNLYQMVHKAGLRNQPSDMEFKLSPSCQSMSQTFDNEQRNSYASFVTHDSSEYQWYSDRSNYHEHESTDRYPDSRLNDNDDQELDRFGPASGGSSSNQLRQAAVCHPNFRISNAGNNGNSSRDITRGLMTGSVQSNQLAPQIIRRHHITSLHVEQQLFLPNDGSRPNSGLDPDQNHQLPGALLNNPHQQDQRQDLLMSGRDEWEYAGQEMEEEEEEKRRRRRGGDDAEEILDQRSPLSAAEAQSSDHNRLTYLTNMTYNTDFESDYGEGSTRYASGHSISSEDPFQYWHYETPRQAREKGTQSHLISQQTLPVLTESLNNQSNQQTEHPRHLSNQPKESLLPGKVPLPQSVLPLQSRSTAQLQLRNFSRPIRSGSAPGDRPLTPPPSREVSPRDLKPQNSNFEIGSASDHRWSNSNLGIDITYQAAESALSDRGIAASRHTSNDDDNQSLGRQSSSSLNSTDSMSLNGTRRSWKKFFQKRKEQDSTAAELSFQPRQPLSSTSPLDLPSITFHSPDISQAVQVEESWTNSQIGKSYEGNWNLMKNEAGMAGKLPHGSDQVQIHFQATNKPISLHGQSADGFEPTRSTYFSLESARESNAVYNKDFNDRRNPKASHRLSIYSLGEGEDSKHSNDNSTQKTRYMSRSPVSVTNFTINSPDSSHQTIDEAESAIQPRAKQVNYSSNLPSAMAKTKATLSSRAQNLNSSSSGMSRSSSKAEEYLQLGIEAHERGDLEKSAGLFERSARENGGCGAGMLMWGLSLRHGWGCQVNEARAFKWLQKAAESVVDNLDVNVAKQSNKKGKEEAVAAKTELVLAIYELGQCFLRGWGCKKDKKLAINYFELAAKLGDPDAQQELGFCYANGQGTKRDLKKAAKYYRMAAEQGVEMMGSQWIWKDKYN